MTVPLPPALKLVLALRIVSCFAAVVVQQRRMPLPELVRHLGRPVTHPDRPLEPARLGSIVGRVLRVGRHRARCLHASLVLYRLLVRQGARPSLVIGLPAEPADKDAHAWVELDGVDVGPPPGGRRHRALARYP